MRGLRVRARTWYLYVYNSSIKKNELYLPYKNKQVILSW